MKPFTLFLKTKIILSILFFLTLKSITYAQIVELNNHQYRYDDEIFYWQELDSVFNSNEATHMLIEII